MGWYELVHWVIHFTIYITDSYCLHHCHYNQVPDKAKPIFIANSCPCHTLILGLLMKFRYYYINHSFIPYGSLTLGMGPIIDVFIVICLPRTQVVSSWWVPLEFYSDCIWCRMWWFQNSCLLYFLKKAEPNHFSCSMSNLTATLTHCTIQKF